MSSIEERKGNEARSMGIIQTEEQKERIEEEKNEQRYTDL